MPCACVSIRHVLLSQWKSACMHVGKCADVTCIAVALNTSPQRTCTGITVCYICLYNLWDIWANGKPFNVTARVYPLCESMGAPTHVCLLHNMFRLIKIDQWSVWCWQLTPSISSILTYIIVMHHTLGYTSNIHSYLWANFNMYSVLLL